MKRKYLKLFFDNAKGEDKKIKGMTLIEVIIAMVVLVLMSTMVAMAASGVVTNVRTSKSVIEKVNYQSKYITGTEKKYVADDGGGGTVEKNMNKTSLSFSLQDSSGGALGNTINADVYEAPGMADAIDYADGTYKRSDGTVYDKAGNLKYFE
jgi:prepilin-type N-terminal cleavage/methylation domain-containing protein